MRGVFVTGTGTGVGKTVVSAVIAAGLRASGESVAVFKPALTGLDEAGEPDHELLRRASGTSQSDDEIAPYRFGPALSPHLAAELASVEIERELLLGTAHRAGADGAFVVCEGVGGLLVPLNSTYLVRDLAVDLALSVVVVAEPGLGTINHTLLTLEAARAAGLTVACVVLNPWPDEPGAIERSNRETLARLGTVRVARLPRVDLADLASWPGAGREVAGDLQSHSDWNPPAGSI